MLPPAHHEPARPVVLTRLFADTRSYNEIDGIPTSSDYWLLTEQLRGAFGFDGYVSSDFGAISGLGLSNHAVAANDSEAVRMFLTAGGSVNGHDFGSNYEQLVVGLVESGRVPITVLDTAVANVLRVKTRLGLVPTNQTAYSPYTDETRVQSSLGDNAAHRALAERAARESVVLLRNEDNTLPLDPAKTRRLLVVGPNADEARTGGPPHGLCHAPLSPFPPPPGFS